MPEELAVWRISLGVALKKHARLFSGVLTPELAHHCGGCRKIKAVLWSVLSQPQHPRSLYDKYYRLVTRRWALRHLYYFTITPDVDSVGTFVLTNA
ncbi:hypothetical protein KQX54_004821 [Cotesia glomerata]|uniref:Uncharacterized protein n=1 Tax=Cotesia glomerata TaxID=32391 RepID=A0AAV7HXD2_COTGL|nr:hypothetical protein KQX54_004821 [Cotesia glomerata]